MLISLCDLFVLLVLLLFCRPCHVQIWWCLCCLLFLCLLQKYCAIPKAIWFESCHWRGINNDASR